MLYGENRSDYRKIFFTVWQKHQNNEALEALEKKILSVLLLHPEYHKVFTSPEKFIEKDYFAELGETNPFLHLSLHLTLLEQIQTDQPRGITALYQLAVKNFHDEHAAYHCCMNSLVEELHQTLQQQSNFDEAAYLNRIEIAIQNGNW